MWQVISEPVEGAHLRVLFFQGRLLVKPDLFEGRFSNFELVAGRTFGPILAEALRRGFSRGLADCMIAVSVRVQGGHAAARTISPFELRLTFSKTCKA